MIRMNNYSFYKLNSAEIVNIKNSVIGFEEHCHTDDFVFTVMLNGSAKLKKDKNIQNISAGDMFGVVPYQSHSLVSDEAVDLLSVCIKKRVIYDFELQSFLEFINHLLKFIRAYIDFNTELLENLIREIYSEHHNTPHTARNIFEISREKIVAEPEKEKTLEEYAKEIYVSKFYYIRKIKEVSGLAPHKLIIQSRIRKSQLLLCNGSDIVQTALTMGFYDQSHFNKYFNKIVGIPPSEYLNSIQQFFTRINCFSDV